jgi:hypothetical protein
MEISYTTEQPGSSQSDTDAEVVAVAAESASAVDAAHVADAAADNDRWEAPGPGTWTRRDGEVRHYQFRDFEERDPELAAWWRELAAMPAKTVYQGEIEGQPSSVEVWWETPLRPTEECDWYPPLQMAVVDRLRNQTGSIDVHLSSNSKYGDESKTWGEAEELGGADEWDGRLTRVIAIEPDCKATLQMFADPAAPTDRSRWFERLYGAVLENLGPIEVHDWSTFEIDDPDERAAMKAWGAYPLPAYTPYDVNNDEVEAAASWYLPLDPKLVAQCAAEYAEFMATPASERVAWGVDGKARNGFEVPYVEFRRGDVVTKRVNLAIQPTLLDGGRVSTVIGRLVRDKFPRELHVGEPADSKRDRVTRSLLITDDRDVVRTHVARGFAPLTVRKYGELIADAALRPEAYPTGFASLITQFPGAEFLWLEQDFRDPRWPELASTETSVVMLTKDADQHVSDNEDDRNRVRSIPVERLTHVVRDGRFNFGDRAEVVVALATDYGAKSYFGRVFDRLEVISDGSAEQLEVLAAQGFVQVDPATIAPPFDHEGYELDDRSRVFVLDIPRTSEQRIRPDQSCAL